MKQNVESGVTACSKVQSIAGTRVGVPTLLQLISVASLARMGISFRAPCVLKTLGNRV